MRRRQLLSATGALVGGSLVGSGVVRSTPSPTGFQPVGHRAATGLTDAVVAPDDETVYVAASNGFVVFDVADPEDPTVIAERRDLLADRDGGPMEQVYDVAIDGDRLLVVGPAERDQAGQVQGGVFFDVSDPSDPRQVGVYGTDYAIHNSAFADGVAYLVRNTTDRAELVLVAADDEPERVGSWSLMDEEPRWQEVDRRVRMLHDVTVHEGRAYLAHWDAGTWVLDVSDPTAPEALARIRGESPAALADLDEQAADEQAFQVPGNDHQAAVTEDASLLGVNVESWDETPGDDSQGGLGGIELWDVADLDEPERLAVIDAPASPDPTFDGVWTTSHNFAFADDCLYTSWYRAGVKVFDVADPTDPVEIASWADVETTEFWTAEHAGDAVVAPSRRDPSEGTTGSRLYVFPDPATDDASGEEASAAADGPGFGVLGALAGAGLAGLGLARRRGWRQD